MSQSPVFPTYVRGNLMRNGQNIGLSRRLRENSTSPERLLWYHLRNRRLNGRKFRRQHTMGPFIVDFCCTELSLVVELDGDVHGFRETKDAARQTYLEEQGYRVVRFTNSDVLDNLPGVLETLWEITKRDKDAPSP